MRQFKFVLAWVMAAALAACGGDHDDKPPVKPTFSAQVTFGDSLADVGTDAVGAVAAAGGGKFTINGDNTAINPALTGKVWSELIAAQLGLPAPCAAQTGLDGDPALGFSVPVVNHAGCYGYAQPGARVTEPMGPRNKATGSPLGQLTVPVATQVANHLALSGGRFRGDELVFVSAGGNDALFLLDELGAGAAAAGKAAGASTFANSLVLQLAAGASDPATAAVAIGAALQAESARPGHTDDSVVRAAVNAAASQPGNARVADAAVYGPMVAKALADGAAAGAAAGAAYLAANSPGAVAAMAKAGLELAALVRNRIVGNGANFVAVNNIPDVSVAPIARAQPAQIQDLIRAMVNAFNTALKDGLVGAKGVLQVDLFALVQDQAANPAPYGLTNVTTPACGPNLLNSAVLCNATNLNPGDVSHYMFADDAHPTPFEHALVARYIALQMIRRGWL